MKKRKILMASVHVLFIISSQSCSKDDDTVIDRQKGRSVTVVFENYIGDKEIKINENIDYMTSQKRQTIHKVSAFDYIVGNFSLKDKTGKPFVYPKDNSYFIISEEGKEDETEKKKIVEALLENIPAGTYTSMTFTVGVDYDKWKQGSAQDDLWKLAAHYAMTWSWAVGYKNLRFEGLLSDKEVTTPSMFMLHIGNDGGYRARNYRTITLNFPSDHPLLVSEDLQDTIHIHVNAGKLLDGENKNKIPNIRSMFSIMMGTTKFADNMTEMFTVKSVESKESAK